MVATIKPTPERRTLMDDEAKYRQVKAIILTMIREGEVAAGERIPSENELVSAYNVSKTTVRRAIDELVLEGHLRREQGKGTFVEDLVFVRNGKLVRQTAVIGVGIYDFAYISAPYFSLIIQGIAEVAQERNYTIQLVSTDREVRQEYTSFYSQLLAEGKVDGLVVIDQIISDADLLDLKHHNLPVVLVERSVPDSPFSTIAIDNRSAMVQILEHLITLGHERIATITGNLEFLQSRERLQAYKSALELCGLDYDPGLVAEWKHDSAAQALGILRSLLDKPDPPTAIVAHNDGLALYCLKALRTLRINVPQQMSLVGFENTPTAGVVSPALTTVDTRLREIGKEAGNALISALESNSQITKNVVLQPKLVVRESTSIAPTVSRAVGGNGPGEVM